MQGFVFFMAMILVAAGAYFIGDYAKSFFFGLGVLALGESIIIGMMATTMK